METRALTAARKRSLARQINDGEGGAASELVAIDRLERSLAGRERVQRIRQMTRRET